MSWFEILLHILVATLRLRFLEISDKAFIVACEYGQVSSIFLIFNSARWLKFCRIVSTSRSHIFALLLTRRAGRSRYFFRFWREFFCPFWDEYVDNILCFSSSSSNTLLRDCGTDGVSFLFSDFQRIPLLSKQSMYIRIYLTTYLHIHVYYDGRNIRIGILLSCSNGIRLRVPDELSCGGLHKGANGRLSDENFLHRPGYATFFEYLGYPTVHREKVGSNVGNPLETVKSDGAFWIRRIFVKRFTIGSTFRSLSTLQDDMTCFLWLCISVITQPVSLTRWTAMWRSLHRKSGTVYQNSHLFLQLLKVASKFSRKFYEFTAKIFQTFVGIVSKISSGCFWVFFWKLSQFLENDLKIYPKFRRIVSMSRVRGKMSRGQT